jgi:ribosomal protein S18 acetylase RimI-like enzyme
MTHIRKASPNDAADIARFNQAMALETERRHLDELTVQAGVRSLFERPDLGFYVVAEQDGQPAGCLLITYEWSDWRNGVFWWLQSVYVLPEFRGKGLYRAMYSEVKRLAAEHGNVSGFRLYVEKENSRAIRIYEHLGMHEAPYLMYEETL